MLKKSLQDFGFNEKEIEIYLAILPLGTTTASVISKRVGIVRSTTHYICQELVKKGVLTFVEKGNTFLFSPESPDKLIFLLEQEENEIKKKKKKMEVVVGALKRLQNPNSVLPKVQFFEGKEGLIKLYEQILDLESPIDSFEDKGGMVTFIPEYVPKFIQKRKERKIYNRVICPEKNPINRNSQEELRDTRNLDEKQFPLSCDIKICDNQVSIFSFEKNTAVGIAIKHKDIAENFRLLFEVIWKNLSR